MRDFELENHAKATRICAYSEEQYAADVAVRKRRIMEFFNATNFDWENYDWQMENRISTLDVLGEIFELPPERREEIKNVDYRWSVTPYYLSLTDVKNPRDEIGLMALPGLDETKNIGDPDPMAEENTNPAGSITRRYPDRCIINVTNKCGMYCRFCQRKRKIGGVDQHTDPKRIRESIEYVRQHTSIRDVLITGGDALTLSTSELEHILNEIRNISHVEIIRLGTRVPVTVPQRIDAKLVDMLKKYHPLYVNVQFNHPKELTGDAGRACAMLADAGIPLGNQMVLLKGVNDDKGIVMDLNRRLLRHRVKPYYVFHAKNVQGAAHFQCDIETGLDIMDNLIGNTTGMARPHYIINAKGGLGKIPLLRPKYREVTEGGKKIYELTTWEDRIVTCGLCGE
ncbi:MAG: KamA family radical SAM protein [Defluviitaleaceae bacterium]|nr:KamA family radical SAM protein [Defluviitaleaceae bacterium]